jgi:catechol 2,3-dioxygenase-like lactoylglutathione lyase family enzyme
MHAKFLFAAVGYLFISACTATSSNDVATAQMDVDIAVEAEGSETRVVASLRTDAPKFQSKVISLAAGDQLRATLSGGQQRLSFVSSEYQALFHQNRGGATLELSLDRVIGEDARASVIMPMPLFISAPAATEAFTRGDLISIAWTPGDAAEDVLLGFKLVCAEANPHGRDTFYHTVFAADSGAFTIAVEDIVTDTALPQFQVPQGAACATEITASRSAWGGYAGGARFGRLSIGAYQRDRVSVVVFP